MSLGLGVAVNDINNNWAYRYHLSGTETTITNTTDQLDGYYFANGAIKTQLDTDNTFVFLLTNALSIDIPEELGAVEILTSRVSIPDSLIGLDSGKRRIATTSTTKTYTYPFADVPLLQEAVNPRASTATTNTINTYRGEDPAWENVTGSNIGFVRKEGSEIVQYLGTIEAYFFDIPEGRFAEIDLMITERKVLKYFCLLGIAAPNTGVIYSIDNCLNLIRAYARRDRQKLNFYKTGDNVFISFSEPIDNIFKKENKHYADIYKYTNGIFLRQKEGSGSLSAISSPSDPRDIASISYHPKV